MAKNVLSAEERLDKLEESLSKTRDRVLYCERALRVIGIEAQRRIGSEEEWKKGANRAHALSNAMREVRENLMRYGNEFDKPPHMPDARNTGDSEL